MTIKANTVALALALAISLIPPPTTAHGQDISRPSLGGERAANPIQSNPVPASRYNIKLGPVKMLMNASMSTSYNSNINVSDQNPMGSLVFSPRIGMGVYWPITKANRLRFNLEFGYDYYTADPSYGGQTLLISPETEFFFNIMVGDVKITLFDRPSITNNPVDNPSLSDAVNYTIFNNTAGLSLVWDLNDVQLGAGFSNFINYAINDDFNYLNRISNQVFLNGSFLVLPYLRLGLEGSATASNYLEGSSDGPNSLNNSLDYTLGAFAQGNLSRYVEFTAGTGWQMTDFNESNNPLNTGNYSKPYFYLNVDHTLNRYFSHRISSGFEGVPSSESNWLALFYTRYSFGWMVLQDWSLGGSAFFETGTESSGPNSEDFNRVGGNLAVSRQLGKHLTLSIYYGVTAKESTVFSYAYNQQIFGANFSYDF
jgi:hypothetical protein